MSFDYWGWLVLGGILIVAEAFAPGFVLVWPGGAAVLTGLVAWLLPELAWQWQVLLFALLTVTSLAFWFMVRRPTLRDAPEGALNRRAEQLTGQTFRLVEPIENGRGRVRAGDTLWPVAGPDLPVGAAVRVIGADGTRLLVEPGEPAP